MGFNAGTILCAVCLDSSIAVLLTDYKQKIGVEMQNKEEPYLIKYYKSKQLIIS